VPNTRANGPLHLNRANTGACTHKIRDLKTRKEHEDLASSSFRADSSRLLARSFLRFVRLERRTERREIERASYFHITTTK